MAAPWDVTAGRVRCCATVSGTYVDVGFVRSFEMTEGSDGDTTLRYFGGDAVVAGDPTISGTIPVWFDRTTTGQAMLRTAKRAGTSIWLQFCPEGTATGKKCDQFEAKITEVSASMDSDGDAVEGSFSYTGVPSGLTEVTLA